MSPLAPEGERLPKWAIEELVAGRRRPHLWRMTSQRGRECEWECHCGCGAHKTTYDGNG